MGILQGESNAAKLTVQCSGWGAKFTFMALVGGVAAYYYDGHCSLL